MAKEAINPSYILIFVVPVATTDEDHSDLSDQDEAGPESKCNLLLHIYWLILFRFSCVCVSSVHVRQKTDHLDRGFIN